MSAIVLARPTPRFALRATLRNLIVALSEAQTVDFASFVTTIVVTNEAFG